MAEKHELAYIDYQSGMKYKEIAEKYDVETGTVKKWKTRYKWERNDVHKICPQNEKGGHTEVPDGWPVIENEYITDISRKPCTLEDLSVKYNIALQTMFDYSSANNWKEKRRNYKETTKKISAEKTADLLGDEIAKANARHLYLSNKILGAISKALADEDELFKYTEILRTGQGTGIFADKLEMQILPALNSKRVTDLTKALKENQEIQRKALGTLTPADKHRIEYDNERLKLERQKAERDNDVSRPIEITIKRAAKGETENSQE